MKSLILLFSFLVLTSAHANMVRVKEYYKCNVMEYDHFTKKHTNYISSRVILVKGFGLNEEGAHIAMINNAYNQCEAISRAVGLTLAAKKWDNVTTITSQIDRYEGKLEATK